jgi:regulator of protease activity HflC (stomatin/prohibitin superfamily)
MRDKKTNQIIMADQNIREMNKLLKKAPWKVLLIAVGIVILPFVFKPGAQIGAGQGGNVLNFGVIQNKILGEGIHFKIPVAQTLTPNDVKIQKALTGADSSSSDLQDISMSAALNYHIKSDKSNLVYQTDGIAF